MDSCQAAPVGVTELGTGILSELIAPTSMQPAPVSSQVPSLDFNRPHWHSSPLAHAICPSPPQSSWGPANLQICSVMLLCGQYKENTKRDKQKHAVFLDISPPLWSCTLSSSSLLPACSAIVRQVHHFRTGGMPDMLLEYDPPQHVHTLCKHHTRACAHCTHCKTPCSRLLADS
jgi:hypothetical protein